MMIAIIAEMFADLHSWLKDDHIKCGKTYIRALSLMWWIVRFVQVSLALAGFYIAYMGMYLFMS